MQHSNSDQRMGTKSIVGISGCLLGLAIVYFGYGVGSESPKKEAAARATAVEAKNTNKPVRAMNVALGNLVFFARELGFTASSVKDDPIDSSKIAMRIETQLQNLRDFYRLAILKNPGLAGPITLELDISPSGQVTQVREISSRINDADFQKGVIAEASKWSFADFTSNNIKVTCPLLFVHEGMDITTLVQWEKSAGTINEKLLLSHGGERIASNPPQSPARSPLASTALTQPTPAAVSRTESNPASDTQVFQIKYATSLRKEPNFNAPAITSYTIGMKVVVLKRHGDWLEVRSENGPTGFIRKEFVTALDLTQK